MAKKKIAVLFGGASSEHDISLVSAYTVLTNIPRDKYEVICVGITKKGHWMYYPGEYEQIKTGEWENNHDCCTAILSPDAMHKGVIVMGDDSVVRKVDAVFPVLHGMNGEDGSVQGLCQLAGIPCVGCDMTSSAVCMDKTVTHKVLDAVGIKTAQYVEIDRRALKDMDSAAAEAAERLGFPICVKPAKAGSSVGVTMASDPEQLKRGIKIALAHGKKALAERVIVGKEVECAVLGSGAGILASIPGQITAPDGFYDYDEKYNSSSTSALDIPAKITPEETQRLRQTAIEAYTACGCSGFARVDFFVTETDIIVNEINTIPGFTAISMYPKLMENMGIPLPELVDRLIEAALDSASEA